MEILLKILLILYSGKSLARRKDRDEHTRVGFMQDNLQHHRVRVGQDISFVCQVRNIGKYKVAWLHADKGIIAVHPHVLGQNERIKSTHDRRDSWSLIIKSVQESDAGKYICQVNTEKPDSISGTLSVEVPPDIIDDLSSSDTLVQEGMRVTLSCESRGVPKPTITWRREPKNGLTRHPEMIRLCNKTRVDTKMEMYQEVCNEVEQYVGEVLELTNVNRHDSGTYLCIANNKVPPSVSKRVQLYVDFPPTLSVFHQLVGKVIGQNVTLECAASGHPKPVHYWMKDDIYITESEKNKYIVDTWRQKNGDRSILMKLTVLNVQKEDFGTYKCMARNSLGDSKGSIRLYEIYISTQSSTVTTHQPKFVARPEEETVQFKDKDKYRLSHELDNNVWTRTSYNEDQHSYETKRTFEVPFSSSGRSVWFPSLLVLLSSLFISHRVS